MRTRKENGQEGSQNGKMSRLAKSVMAAGLAVGGAVAYGDMNVYAAENDGAEPGVSVDTQSQTDVEQHSEKMVTGTANGK